MSNFSTRNLFEFRNFIALFSLSLLCLSALGQKQGKFIGMLEYKITIQDTAMRKLIPENKMIVYSNDTIVRTENFTGQFGKQVVIKHMVMNKSYLLLSTPMGNFAIQTDHNKLDTTSKASPYTFKKKMFKKKVIGMKANRMIVTHKDFEEPIEFLYVKKVSNKYNQIFPEIPGLIVKYSLVSPDGILDFELTKYSEFSPNRDLFGIPSDYERITFDAFLEKMTGSKGSKEGE